MALKSNQTHQMAQRLQDDLKRLAPDLTSALSDNLITISDSTSSVVAQILMQRRQFDGFNIAYELDSSAGQGFPEHQCYLAVISSMSLEHVVLLAKAVSAMGCSETNFIKTVAAPAPADLVDANVSAIIPNDARLGSIGA